MTGLEHALEALRQALDAPRRQHSWRWLVRQRMVAVRELLARPESPGGDAWLAAREAALHREQRGLLQRLTELGSQVMRAADVEVVREDLGRLVEDIDHHRQRLNDLVYDTVSLELGGSE